MDAFIMSLLIRGKKGKNAHISSCLLLSTNFYLDGYVPPKYSVQEELAKEKRLPW